MDQNSFSENLVKITVLFHDIASVKSKPLPNGHSIYSINHFHLISLEKVYSTTQMRHLVGSIHWLSQGTRGWLDVVTI